jgi:hypothetical protein
VLLCSLEIGVAEQVGGDADLLGRAVDQLGHSAIPEQVGPNVPAERLLGPLSDLLPDRAAAHRPAAPIEPEVPADTAALALPT